MDEGGVAVDGVSDADNSFLSMRRAAVKPDRIEKHHEEHNT